MAIERDKQNNKKVTKVTCCLGDYHGDGKDTREAAAPVFFCTNAEIDQPNHSVWFGFTISCSWLRAWGDNYTHVHSFFPLVTLITVQCVYAHDRPLDQRTQIVTPEA